MTTLATKVREIKRQQQELEAKRELRILNDLIELVKAAIEDNSLLVAVPPSDEEKHIFLTSSSYNKLQAWAQSEDLTLRSYTCSNTDPYHYIRIDAINDYS